MDMDDGFDDDFDLVGVKDEVYEEPVQLDDLDEWKSAKSATGYMGVQRAGKKFSAQIHIPGKSTTGLGTYDKLRDAVQAFATAYLHIHKKTPQEVLADKIAADDNVRSLASYQRW